MTLAPTKQTESILFTQPTKQDGADMWNLVNETSLDQNSAYKYIMMSEFFADTCIVAKRGHELVGFVTAFRPPNRQDALFIWQIGVKPSEQGNGIASQLLQEMLKRDHNPAINYVEATITPSNGASQALFKKLARDLNTECVSERFFTEELFPGDTHEEELMFRIGPLSS
uniref:L-2,4-diaminobutyric acid acetyltransferase n=1 Tax=Alkalihalobacillus alcalophilus TaxID=1445 RepID=Q1HMR4_ALKAL|nr:EctA [Alkalihalobacillus alcalophilus]